MYEWNYEIVSYKGKKESQMFLLTKNFPFFPKMIKISEYFVYFYLDIITNMDELIANSCEQVTKQLLELAQTFARKSRRPSTKLTCIDLINAFECMNILYKQKTVRNEEIFLKNSFNQIFEIEYK